jgi:hypothetical protein
MPFNKTLMFTVRNMQHRSQGSSGSIVSDYGMDDRAIGVRSPAGAKDFSSSLCVQTGSGAHPASYPMGTGVLSPGVKRGRGVTLTTHPHLVPRSWMIRSYTSSPPSATMVCSGTTLLLQLKTGATLNSGNSIVSPRPVTQTRLHTAPALF